MAPPTTPRETLERTIALLHEALEKGHKPPGVVCTNREKGALRIVEEGLGIGPTVIHNRLRQAERLHGLKVDWTRYRDGRPSNPELAPAPEPLELRNLEFWKRRARALADDLAAAEHLLNEVSGLMARPIEPPRWTLPSPRKTQKNRAAGLLHISDIHAGEVIRSDEVNGLNEYDLDVCKRRLRRLFAAAIEILPRWTTDCHLAGVWVALNGDLVSGDIHDELRETNALTAQEQIWFVSDELAAGLEKLADVFGEVTAVVTCGNHGRSTHKTHAKRTAALNYDSLIGEALRRYFIKDERVTITVSPSRDAVFKLFQWTILQTHGDQGGGGGQGFAGPGLPILRKGKSIEWMAAQTREFFDVILSGHYHTSANMGKILANGSVVGYGEFARSIRASPEVPQQWLCLIHERWCVREKMEIKLETPRPGA